MQDLTDASHPQVSKSPRMASVARRVHQVFGADTDVGKTIFSTALLLASAARGSKVAYVKPVSTGAQQDMDARHVRTFAPQVPTRTLVQFSEPVSPHMAAALQASPDEHVVDAQIVERLRTWLHECGMEAAIVETAGGVHSPSPSGSSQADLLRPLRLPTILVGSSVLGGISSTRASFESLRMRGYDIDVVLMFTSPYYGNDTYLAQYFAEHGIPLFTIEKPPARVADTPTDVARMQTYYQHTLTTMAEVVQYLADQHARRYASLDTLGMRAHQHMWWPFTQHTRVAPQDVTIVDSAHSDFFEAHAPGQGTSPMLDGSASWWTQAVGHGHPRLALAAAYAAGRYGHVLSPSVAHEPAVRLAERLLGHGSSATLAPGRGWASRVFFTDDGSTGMEVALKMAMQASVRRYTPTVMSSATLARTAPGRRAGSLGGRQQREWHVLGLQGSYHGDTIGAMDACEPSVFSEHVAWYRGRGYWLAPPALRMKEGKVRIEVPASDEWGESQCLGILPSIEAAYRMPARLQSELAQRYVRMLNKRLEELVLVEGHRFGALVLEPLVMGAGGMIFVDPLFQRCLVDVVRSREDLFSLSDPPLRDACVNRGEDGWRGLPVVYDEVFTGLHRLGFAMGADVLGAPPDINCLAKILTGGVVPMSVTLASDSIFRAFAMSDQKTHALLHGHSYTAHPVGCQVTLETLDMLDEMPTKASWDPAWLERMSHARRLRGIMSLGTVLKLELESSTGGYASDAADDLLRTLRAGSFPIHLRSLGQVVYIMTSLTTPADTLARIQTLLEHEFL